MELMKTIVHCLKKGYVGFDEIFLTVFETLPQKQPPKVFHKKGVLKNFTKFTGKHVPRARRDSGAGEFL